MSSILETLVLYFNFGFLFNLLILFLFFFLTGGLLKGIVLFLLFVVVSLTYVIFTKRKMIIKIADKAQVIEKRPLEYNVTKQKKDIVVADNGDRFELFLIGKKGHAKINFNNLKIGDKYEITYCKRILQKMPIIISIKEIKPSIRRKSKKK